MEPLAVLALSATRMHAQQAHSALPDAPVLAETRPSVLVRSRAATATALRHAADAVAPSTSTLSPSSQVG